MEKTNGSADKPAWQVAVERVEAARESSDHQSPQKKGMTPAVKAELVKSFKGLVIVAVLICVAALAVKLYEMRGSSSASSHNYTVVDGREYGYPQEVSTSAKQEGRVAGSVIMFRYAGVRNGKHQLLVVKGDVITAFECAEPCQVIKVMAVPTITAPVGAVHIEHLQYNPASIAGAAIDDAVNGRLELYEDVDNLGRKTHMWIDEKVGLRRELIGS